MLKAVSLFSGAGGLNVGVEKSGFANICSIELDQHCANTLRQNSTLSKKIWNADIRAISPKGLLSSLNMEKGEIDLLHGGPPCQSFSQIGNRKELSDPRGLLAFQMTRFTKRLRPKAVLIEQVSNFVKAKFDNNSSVVQELQRQFELMGYSLQWQIMDASEFGVAQKRRRVFLVALRQDRPNHFLFPVGGGVIKSVADAISSLPPPTLKGNDTPIVPSHVDITPARDRERIAPVLEGEWLSKTIAPKELIGKLSKKDTTKFRRLSRREPALTLRCGEIFFHPVEDRYVTPREEARLHGYSDKYLFTGPIRGRSGSVSNLDQHRQIANSVPPPLATAIANEIRGAICR